MEVRKDIETVEAEIIEDTDVEQIKTMEFKLINPTEDSFLRCIKWNKEELEEAVKTKIVSYQNVVYLEDNIKIAKKDKADLNKLIKSIEDRRKQVKRIINEPYEKFEKELKEILELINKPVQLIDQQIKAFEEKKKKEKKVAIKLTYDENIGELKEILQFETIFDMRYLNQTYRLVTAQKEIKDKIERVKSDLEIIDRLDSKYKLNAKDVYIKTLDLSQALAENKRLEELEIKLELENKRQEEEKKQIRKENEVADTQKKEIQKVVLTDNQHSVNVNQQFSDIEYSNTDIQGNLVDPFIPKVKSKKEKTFRVRFYADGTKEQLEKLIVFMNENNIQYGKIKQEN